MAKTLVQDEVLYCTRCGISFLWSQEERKLVGETAGETAGEAAAQPQLCPACRLLLPAAGRERGLVKWYNGRKQYGFIVRAGHPDIYVHRTGTTSGRPLRPGDLVEFAVEQTERGPAAVAVAVVQPASATTDNGPADEDPGR